MIGAIETPISAVASNIHLAEMIKAAGASGEPLPSAANIALLNTLFNGLESAITDGSPFRNVYADVLIYATDNAYVANGNDLGFVGRKCHNPYVKATKAGGGTLSKTVKKGFQTDGVAYINRNYIANDESITSTTDAFNLLAWLDTVNALPTHQSGVSGVFFQTSNVNYGFGIYRGKNLASPKTGYLLFYSEINPTDAKFYWVNTLQDTTTTVLSGSKPTISMYSLCSNIAGSASFYINSATKEAINITGRRSSINRTTLYNAVNNYINAVQLL